MPPLKRHPALQPLSRQHHDGLLLVWKLRQGLSRHIDPERMGRYVRAFWDEHLVPHFADEEEQVFALFPAGHAGVARALGDHAAIRALCLQDQPSASSLTELADLLEAHIRFEERELFAELQQVMSPEAAAVLRARLHDRPACGDGSDRFWEA